MQKCLAAPLSGSEVPLDLEMRERRPYAASPFSGFSSGKVGT